MSVKVKRLNEAAYGTAVEMGVKGAGSRVALRECDDHFLRWIATATELVFTWSCSITKKGKALARGVEIQVPTLAM